MIEGLRQMEKRIQTLARGNRVPAREWQEEVLGSNDSGFDSITGRTYLLDHQSNTSVDIEGNTYKRQKKKLPVEVIKRLGSTEWTVREVTIDTTEEVQINQRRPKDWTEMNIHGF